MGTLSAFAHHDSTVHHALVRMRATLYRGAALAWDAICSTGPRPEMPPDALERHLPGSEDEEGASRRLHACGDAVSRPAPLVRN